MLVVLPICNKDSWLAVKNLGWCKKLQKNSPFDALVVHDDVTDSSDVIHAARGWFNDVFVYQYQHWTGKLDFPFIQNNQWQVTARHIHSNCDCDCWFWWESDCTPIKAGWLETLYERWKSGGKPYLGTYMKYAPFSDGKVREWINGVAIYPKDAVIQSPRASLAFKVPWDVASGPDVVSKATRANDILPHCSFHKGMVPSFRDQADVDEIVPKTAVCWHKCKDGSLIDVLAGEPFLQRVAKKIFPPQAPPNRSKMLVVCLGRYGDILNAIPIAYYLHKAHDCKVDFLVSNQYADILDGFSYIRPVVWNGPCNEMQRAVKEHTPRYDSVICAQVYGRPTGQAQEMDAYNVEAWYTAGMVDKWGKVPLVVDQRDKKREEKLANEVLPKTNLPIVLFNVTGQSSPYPHAEDFKSAIIPRYSGLATVIDIGEVKAHRVYDLLGLYDRAKVLVTIDTSTLHLAGAHTIPTVAFISDCNSLWHGTRTYCNIKFQVRYRESKLRFEDVFTAIDECIGLKQEPVIKPEPVAEGEPVLWHVVQRYPITNPDALRRFEFARKTWEKLYAEYGWTPLHVWRTHRDSRALGGKKILPFLKDIWKRCLDISKNDNDLLIYTNDDTVLLPSIDGVLREWMKDKDCGCSFRNNYDRGAVKNPEELNCKNTKVDFGRDLFVFKVGWLRSHWADIPDCLNGASEWDYFLALYFRHLAKIPLSMADMHFPNPKTEMERGHVFHEAHEPNRYADKLEFLRVENYNKSEVKRAIKALGIKGMHLSS